jgi:maleylpyruvate isomerase
MERETDYRWPVSLDPLALAEDVVPATARLLETARSLSDADLAAPSLLPGWTRGHVLTHIARNADGAVNLLTWARTGVETPPYESLARRASDIEAGAGRPAADHVADLIASNERFVEAVDLMPPDKWSATLRWTSGGVGPAARVVWSRLREVEIHHVDLAREYTAADWPEAFTVRLLTGLAKDFGGREDGPRLVLRAPEIGHDLPVGDGVTDPIATGPAWAAAAWLIGRSAGDGLTMDPPGPLPAVPPLG